MSDKLFPHAVWAINSAAAPECVYHQLTAEFEQGGYLHVITNANNLWAILGQINAAVQSADLNANPSAMLEFTLRYQATYSNEESIRLESSSCCCCPELDETGRTLKQIVMDLIRTTRRNFLRTLARNQFRLNGPEGTLEEVA